MENFLFVLPLEIGAYTAAALTIASNSLLLLLNIKIFGFGGAGNAFYSIALILVGLMMLSGVKSVSFELFQKSLNKNCCFGHFYQNSYFLPQ
jgi:hypothetical protein